MQDRILDAYLKAFTEDYGLGTLDEGSAFELFVGHLVTSRYFAGQFEPDEVSTGGGGDLGIDGLAIIVNDNIAHAVEDVDYFRKQLRRLDVQFHFVQAKTSPSFDSAAIGTFFAGVRSFLGSDLPADANVAIRDAHALKEHVYDQSVHMDAAPTCTLHYACTGSWQAQPALLTRIEQGASDLKRLALFSKVDFVPWDADRLKSLHRALHGRVVREISFEKHTIVPPIQGVQEAFIGILPCKEYLKLLVGDDGELDRRLFYDNVRDFQGHNSVNLEIAQSITNSPDRSDRFVLLNNGVTIVASDVSKVGARFRLSEYQIVNGCQTSHIIFMNRDKLSDEAHLPLKLIVTNDVEVMTDITQATNRQTEVKREAFESLRPFQKRLEELYLAMGRSLDEPLYYERRSKQYDHLDAQRDRVVSLPQQLNCFMAMFLNEPHSTHRYYGELLHAYGARVFSDSHSPMPYFTSGLALSTVERLLAKGTLPRHLRPFKHHLLMVIRMQATSDEIPPLNAHRRLDSYCGRLIEMLTDRARATSAFVAAADVLEGALERLEPAREGPARRRAFTELVIDQVGLGAAMSAGVDRVTGRVQAFSDTKGFGHIEVASGERYFVHYSDITGDGYRTLLAGQTVSFVPVEDIPSARATDVQVEA